MRWLLTLAWCMGIVYATIPLFWLLVHPFADFWRARTVAPFRLLIPMWLLIMVGLGAASWRWRLVQLYATPWSLLPAAVFVFSAVLVYRRVDKAFDRAKLLGLAELRPAEHEQKLIVTGMHARVRHPMYLGHLCMMLAWTAGSGLQVMYAFVALAFVSGALMVRLEERELERRFGDDFREYRRRVPALFPSSRPRSPAET